MFFSGIADEAGKAIDTQIKAHQELGWKHIEIRLVDGVQFTETSDAVFEEVAAKTKEAGLRISCFASALANWSRPITGDFELDLKEMRTAIPRMKQTGTQFIRAMSWNNDNLSEEAWGEEAVRRMKELTRMAEEGGVTIVLENCSGYASQSPKHFTEFFDRVGSPAMKAVYDTGNAAAHGHDNTWEWYRAARPHIAYVHIKAHTGPLPNEDDRRMTYPDDPATDSKVRETVTDLLKTGYDGGFSIEPHLAAAIHAGKDIDNAEEHAYNVYLEYGRRLMKMMEEAKAQV